MSCCKVHSAFIIIIENILICLPKVLIGIIAQYHLEHKLREKQLKSLSVGSIYDLSLNGNQIYTYQSKGIQCYTTIDIDSGKVEYKKWNLKHKWIHSRFIKVVTKSNTIHPLRYIVQNDEHELILTNDSLIVALERKIARDPFVDICLHWELQILYASNGKELFNFSFTTGKELAHYLQTSLYFCISFNYVYSAKDKEIEILHLSNMKKCKKLVLKTDVKAMDTVENFLYVVSMPCHVTIDVFSEKTFECLHSVPFLSNFCHFTWHSNSCGKEFIVTKDYLVIVFGKMGTVFSPDDDELVIFKREYLCVPFIV